MKSTPNKFSEFQYSQYDAVYEKINHVSTGPRYRDKTLINQGSQKEIYKVYDTECSREIAMAVLINDSEEEKAQFVREAKITAFLQHPNIMPVYETGSGEDGKLYFTTQLGKGESLQDIFEDVFKSCPEKTIKRIQYHLGNSDRIHGRETFLKKITKPEAIEFLRKNHINIPLKTKYSFGLIDKDKKIVAVACFGQVIRMRNRAKSSELIRFCNISGSRVVGGLTKLINKFQKLHQLDELMTYCDLEWSNGLNFEKLGFTKIETSTPTEFVVNLNSWERIHLARFDASNIQNKNKHQIISNLGSIKFIKCFNEK